MNSLGSPLFLLALFQHCANTGRAKRPSSALSRNYDMNTVAQTVRRLRQSSTGRRRLRFTYLYCDPSRIYAHWCPTSPAEPISTHTQVRGKNIHAPRDTLWRRLYLTGPQVLLPPLILRKINLAPGSVSVGLTTSIETPSYNITTRKIALPINLHTPIPTRLTSA